MAEQGDPAEVARRRREKVQALLRSADEYESLTIGLDSDAAPSPIWLYRTTQANSFRLQAICEHLGLRVE